MHVLILQQTAEFVAATYALNYTFKAGDWQT